MSVKCFVDTNILVYAHDRESGVKYERARELIQELWVTESGVLSTQVLQELYVALRRKVSSPLSAAEAERILFDFFAWEIFTNTRESVIRAVAIETRYKISFWDALILQAAETSDAHILYSEDLQNRRVYGSVQVVNPFTISAAC